MDPIQSTAHARAQIQALLFPVMEQSPDFAPHIHHALEQQGLLGEGGMGRVLRVKDKRLGRDAALKILQPSQGDLDAVLRFKREAQIMARLDHPGIPPVYESGTTPEGQPFLLMKVVEGATLTERIAQYHDDGCPEDERDELLRALIKVSEAVAYAHSRGVIHRDLKPDNIMIGQFGEVLVMDWGLAKLIKEKDDPRLTRPSMVLSAVEAQELGATQAGTVLGTPGYMSPEQVSGVGVTTQADVFALGAILFRLMSNERLIEGESPFKILSNTLKGEIRTLAELKPQAPEAIQSLCTLATSFEAEDRFASALDFGEALQSFLNAAPVGAKRAWLPWFVALVLGMALAVGAWQWQQSQSQSQSQLIAARTSLARAEAEVERLSKPVAVNDALESWQIQAVYKAGQVESLLSLLRESERPRSDWLAVLSFLRRVRASEALSAFYVALEEKFSLSERELVDWCWLLFSERPGLNPPEFLAACERLQRRKPKSLWLKLIDFASRRDGETVQGLETTARLRDQGVVHPLLFFLRSQLQLRLRNLPEAQKELKKALALDPLASKLHLARSTLLDAERKFEASLNTIELYAQLIGTVGARILTADQYYSFGRWDIALGKYRELLKDAKQKSLVSELRRRQGYCLERLGRVREALEIYLRLSDEKPEDQSLMFYILRATQIIQSARPADYIGKLEALEKSLPNFPDLLFEMAWQQWQLGEVFEAQAIAERAWKLRDRMALFTVSELKALRTTLTLKGIALAKPSKLQNWPDLTGWTRGFPKKAIGRLLFDYALVLKSIGKVRVAAELLEELCQDKPQDTHLVEQTSQVLVATGQAERAFKVVQRARWAGNQSPWLNSFEGQVLASVGESKGALLLLEHPEMKKTFEDTVVGYLYSRGFSNFQLGKYQRAMADLEVVIKFDRSEKFLALFAILALELNKPKAAEAVIDEALEKAPMKPEWLFQKACCCSLKREPKQAQKFMQKVLTLSKTEEARENYQRRYNDFIRRRKKPQ